ncbi:hypothetical protein FPV67DRAFT_1446126 [Lyophyllum atratum]|nr:hypothetical protein FPV67DRAFT_1446126 [Lyophyllum atratum]
MPRLWDRLVLPGPLISQRTARHKHEEVDWDFTSGDFPPEEFDERVVFPLPSNLRELVMRVDNEGQLHTWFGPPSGNMDLLESLPPRQPLPLSRSMGSNDAPLYSGGGLPASMARHHPSMPPTAKCCVELFIDASEEGEIDDDEDAAELLPPVTLDRLQDLAVAFLTPASPTVFTGLTCPSLISLLVQQQIHDNDVLRLLRITPHLVGLILECEGDHDELLNALIVPMPGKGDDAPIIVPHLRLFKLSIITFQRAEANLPTFSAPPYVEAIRSRWLRDHESTMERSLPRGILTFRPTLTVDEYHEHVLQQVKMSLEPFQAQGLDLETLVKRGSALGRVELPGTVAWSMWRDEDMEKNHESKNAAIRSRGTGMEDIENSINEKHGNMKHTGMVHGGRVHRTWEYSFRSSKPSQVQWLDLETQLLKREIAGVRADLPETVDWSMWREEAGLPFMLDKYCCCFVLQ